MAIRRAYGDFQAGLGGCAARTWTLEITVTNVISHQKSAKPLYFPPSEGSQESGREEKVKISYPCNDWTLDLYQQGKRDSGDG